MTRWAVWTLGVGLAAVAGASPARADQVTLKNGDLLHGKVEEQGGRVHLKHAILGEVDLSRADVTRITRDGEALPPPAPATLFGERCGCSAAAAAKKDDKKCPRPWKFAIGAGLSNEAGNTEKFAVNVDAEGEYRWRRNWIDGRLAAFYEESQGVQTEGKYFARAHYARDIASRGRVFGLWLLDRDDFADIEIRTGWFAGYAHDFVKRERTTFTGAIGGGVVVEKRSGLPSIETAAALAQLEFEHEWSTGDKFNALAYVIPYLDYVERSPIRFEVRYAHPLREHFFLTAGFLVDYVPDPPGGLKSEDTKLTFGVRWEP